MFTRHFANTLELICDLAPDKTALIHGPEQRSWQNFDDRAARLAAGMLAGGIAAGETVAINMYNCPEWLEAYYAAIKMRAVPANLNYRYRDEELAHVLNDSDAAALIFHSSLAEVVLRSRPRLPRIRLWIMVDDSDSNAASIQGVAHYEDLIEAHEPAARIHRPSDDKFLSYTGGTTGLPRGVSGDLGTVWGLAPRAVNYIFGKAFTTDNDPVEIASTLRTEGREIISLVAPPLMHSTGLQMTAIPTLAAGGVVVTMTSRSFDAHHTLQEVERTGANRLTIVGDAFARPLLRALEEGRPDDGAYCCDSLRLITSAGAAWTASVKTEFLEHLPHLTLLESCGATEGVSLGIKATRKGDPIATGNFDPAEGVLLVDENLVPLKGRPGETGLLAAPTVAECYRNDPEKTARTYRMINGTLYAVPGDHARMELDGSFTLLGRGSSVVNTGGEKVYPEEVEDVISQADGVHDCLVLGIPDERYGQKVAAIVQLTGGITPTPDDIIAHVKDHLAGYKAPRELIFVDSIPRNPNGKGNYALARKMVLDALANRPDP